jgi:hypothetical protein
MKTNNKHGETQAAIFTVGDRYVEVIGPFQGHQNPLDESRTIDSFLVRMTYPAVSKNRSVIDVTTNLFGWAIEYL